MELQALKNLIETAYADPQQMDPKTASATTREAVLYTIQLLNEGQARVAEKHEGNWRVNTWLKQAILLHFRLQPLQIMDAEHTAYHDKIPLKFSRSRFEQAPDVRVVPPAHARFGAYIAPNTILMPSYINIGAYVDSGTMIDTWATVGSCAQIGKNVHLSGGAGIGGVLEPIQSSPTIIEDDCFIGARSEIAEGVIVETGAVIGMGVFIGQSTKIFDRATGEITYGRVPAGSVVVAGSLPAKTGEYSLYAAIIVKRVDAKTRSKTTLNQLLRDE